VRVFFLSKAGRNCSCFKRQQNREYLENRPPGVAMTPESVTRRDDLGTLHFRACRWLEKAKFRIRSLLFLSQNFGETSLGMDFGRIKQNGRPGLSELQAPDF
jgi:hypothetical protein